MSSKIFILFKLTHLRLRLFVIIIANKINTFYVTLKAFKLAHSNIYFALKFVYHCQTFFPSNPSKKINYKNETIYLVIKAIRKIVQKKAQEVVILL